MNSSDAPSRITKAFGVNGLKNTIPVDSSTTTDNSGVATFDKGFPAITMQPLSAGGIPPSGKDMNGALFAVSTQQQWNNAGMGYPFNPEFATAVSGYPKGAVVPNSSLTGQWLNLIEGNSANPESLSASSTGWVPVGSYGPALISMSGITSAVLSSLQASKDRVIISGSLTANSVITFPVWMKSWVVVNNCTGNFTITCKTLSGSGVAIPTGTTACLYCDGANIAIDGPLMVPSGNKPQHAVNLGQFESSLSTLSGYQYLPNGRIEQWGRVAVPPGSATVVVTLAKPFQHAFINGIVSDSGNACIPYGISPGDDLSTIKIYGPVAIFSNSVSTPTPTNRAGSTAYYRVIGY
ncbi:gp53-like domain-containing protein [Enterobacter oligotrophicus]|uniref:gp53-like domain-containing protein n=1 Tax=Enterobacter oligotrophicus TaxID=2478464 RepID=UPI0028A9DD0A|nr:hypothetical protein [Enterobacter oligotrophicus]